MTPDGMILIILSRFLSDVHPLFSKKSEYYVFIFRPQFGIIEKEPNERNISK